MSRDEILQILEEEIVGDGDGYPHQGEREAAADRIWKAMQADQRKQDPAK